jgi:integrase
MYQLPLKIEHRDYTGWIAGSPRWIKGKVHFDYRLAGTSKKYSAPRESGGLEKLDKLPRPAVIAIFERLKDEHNTKHCAERPARGRHSEKKQPERKVVKARKAYGARAKPRQNAETPREDRDYFKDAHRRVGLWVKSFWIVPRPGTDPVRWRIFYESSADDRDHVSPTVLTSWLDGEEETFVRFEIAAWRERVNGMMFNRQAYYPAFFEAHRTKFLKYLLVNAVGVTVQGYLRQLGLHVFPFFCKAHKCNNVADWPQLYGAWNREFLAARLDLEQSRNQVRTALRRYLAFLDVQGLVSSAIARPRNVAAITKGRDEEKPIPGELPDWADVLEWLKTLPRDNVCTWYIALSAIFGVRISEALGIDAAKHLIGAKDVILASKRHTTVATMLKRGKEGQPSASAFLYVERKSGITKIAEEIENLDPHDPALPKSGRYVACCVSADLSKFLGGLITDGHAAKDLKDPIGKYASILKFIAAHEGSNEAFPFHQYRPHDFRRLHVTLSSVWFDSIEMVVAMHGHRNIATTRRYMQWARTQQSLAAKEDFETIDYNTLFVK